MGHRILIVEDEQIIAADMAAMLRRLGHEVVGMASGGEEAIELAEQVKPELVFMDIQLEGAMPGTEAAASIQKSTGSQIIYITAFPGVFLREPDQMAQPGICLSKPFSRLQVEAAVAAALKQSPPRGHVH